MLTAASAAHTDVLGVGYRRRHLVGYRRRHLVGYRRRHLVGYRRQTRVGDKSATSPASRALAVGFEESR
ncbi:hypothetical protein ACWEOA_07245 [Streptomyces sp. NPDC004457]